ncbi:hypothetical protein P168DRAFT_112790 [Aspergillus campestris IBT 28561]|uniref:Uncharacterized protein n=1 Tax=Aspergillus campestris (strain IBT 28561) TaxID=1392248 RepID=A0A2I1D9E3_ASPC2|nr:uncharacterized protein P168DRAFT_112790 [Aspergillus campestris IBT 28561]PKY06490.1 hypothetical protein P168DRAFT_112790 [Aspergillus campestris IBT 28561]
MRTVTAPTRDTELGKPIPLPLSILIIPLFAPCPYHPLPFLFFFSFTPSLSTVILEGLLYLWHTRFLIDPFASKRVAEPQSLSRQQPALRQINQHPRGRICLNL